MECRMLLCLVKKEVREREVEEGEKRNERRTDFVVTVGGEDLGSLYTSR